MTKKLFTRLGIIMLVAALGLSFFSWPADFTARGAPGSPDQGPSVFGVQIDPLINSADGLDWIVSPQTNTHWVRAVEIRWNRVEPTQGAREWSGLNETLLELDNALNNNLTPILLVRGVPVWARPAETAGYLCSPIAQDNLDDFALFIDDVMSNDASPLKDYVDDTGLSKYWEFFNEPDIAPDDVRVDDTWPDCWGDPEAPYYGGGYYVRMLQAVQPIIKANDPQAQVLVGGLVLDCRDCARATFLEGILANSGTNDGGEYFDGVTFHARDYYVGSLGPYNNEKWSSSRNDTGPSLIAQAEYIRGLLQKYGYGGKFLMNTESALVLCRDCTFEPDYETTKAYYLPQAYAAAIAEGLEANFWFDVRGDWEDRLTGLVTKYTLEPLPAYYAYQFASQELEGALYLEEIDAFTGVGGYAFSVGGKIVSLIWSKDGQDHTVRLPAVPSAIYDVDGDPQTPSQILNVGIMPLYIESQASINQSFITMPLLVRNYRELTNGNFESGSQGWTMENHGLPAQVITSGQGETLGSRALRLGSPNYPCDNVPIGYAEARQTFSVPQLAAGESVGLRFRYIIYTQDQSASYDRFDVYVNNQLEFSDYNTSSESLGCNKWFRIPPSAGDWATGSIPLDNYQGKTVSVSFQSNNRGPTDPEFFNTYTYVDNVEIVISD